MTSNDRTKRCDPLKPGISISVADGSLGTLGMFVCLPDGGLCILTADHVIAPRGSEPKLPVYQPGSGEGNLIGCVYKRFRGYDMALVRCNEKRNIDHVPVGVKAKLSGTRAPKVGDILEKSGMATCVTSAKVSWVGCNDYGHVFKLGQLEGSTCPISGGGDSGAIWYCPKTYKAIGIHRSEYRDGGAMAVALYQLADELGLKLCEEEQAR